MCLGDLARQDQADAGPFRLSRKERHEQIRAAYGLSWHASVTWMVGRCRKLLSL
jgi:hypothetical protein